MVSRESSPRSCRSSAVEKSPPVRTRCPCSSEGPRTLLVQVLRDRELFSRHQESAPTHCRGRGNLPGSQHPPQTVYDRRRAVYNAFKVPTPAPGYHVLVGDFRGAGGSAGRIRRAASRALRTPLRTVQSHTAWPRPRAQAPAVRQCCRSEAPHDGPAGLPSHSDLLAPRLGHSGSDPQRTTSLLNDPRNKQNDDAANTVRWNAKEEALVPPSLATPRIQMTHHTSDGRVQQQKPADSYHPPGEPT